MFIDQRFMSKLDGITDPEEKRKLIGAEFIRVFEEESKRLGPFDLLPAALRPVGSDIQPARSSGNRSGLRQPLARGQQKVPWSQALATQKTSTSSQDPVRYQVLIPIAASANFQTFRQYQIVSASLNPVACRDRPAFGDIELPPP